MQTGQRAKRGQSRKNGLWSRSRISGEERLRRRQVPAEQPPSDGAAADVVHLVDGVQLAQDVPARVLVDVRLQVP